MLKGEEKEMVCVKTMWTPYNLVALKELLRSNQYVRLKGIKRFEEEGENIMDRLVSTEERSLPKGIGFGKILNYENHGASSNDMYSPWSSWEYISPKSLHLLRSITGIQQLTIVTHKYNLQAPRPLALCAVDNSTLHGAVTE